MENKFFILFNIYIGPEISRFDNYEMDTVIIHTYAIDTFILSHSILFLLRDDLYNYI